MKQWLKSIFFVGLVSLAFGFVSCAADSGDSTETQPQVQVQTTYYTVSFNSNGGSSVSAQKVESGKTATKPSNPIKEGYSFRGWYNGTSEFDFSTPIKSNITLTAQWTENKTTPETPQNPDTPENPDSPDNPSTPTVTTYTVTFKANGGTGGDTTQTVTFGTTATLTANTFTRTGYTFLGWAKTANAEQIEYADKAEFTTPEQNTTLYALWKPNEYTLTFRANGGTGDDTTQTVTFGTTATLSSNTFTYAGYRFASWNTKADGTGNSYSDSGDFTVSEEKNITLYAQWVENDRYIISYANTRGATNSNPTSYRETEGATLSDLSLTGYTFEGWYSEADADGNGTGTKITGWGAGEKSGDITLYAKWKANSYTITFSANNGTGARKSQTVT
ncbi:MAG: InlB B-repeat-containing protein, partial [Treponema sp.]|nr:InlB B-repeat-containing protein [Treponema sp.]